MSEFKGSIAQVNVQFPIETVIEPIAGANYSRAVIFMPVSKAETYLPGIESAAAGSLTELKSSNYAGITGGLLKSWLVPFFKAAQTAVVGVSIYDDTAEAATHTLAIEYEARKYYGYFKFVIADTTAYNDAQVALAQLCLADPLYSDHWVGCWEKTALTSASPLVTALKAAKANSRVVYNPDTTINAALAQLGRSLSTINSTGTPVGNDVDMVGFNTIGASGETGDDGERENLSATQKTALDNQKVGYNTWVGDGTENVVTEGSLTLQGESVGANWVKHYIEYMCKVVGANYITKMNTFRNNPTYQGILTILKDQVTKFVNSGRLSDFVMTAPVFKDLPQSGDAITVPNAWKATYVDSVREVTVYGTLYLTQPTR